jgi:hypothetical protein
MKTKILIILILLFCFQVNAQSTFKEGFYTNNSGDSIQGLIKDLDWKTNPDEIQFKTNSASRIRNLKPEDISFFEIFNKVKYKSVEVDIDKSDNSISKLSKNRLPEFESEHVFLKVLESGAAKLYKLENSSFIRYFYETEEKSIQQLIYKKYLDKTNKIRENQNFRQQLLNALQCNDLSTNQFKNLKYDERSLKKIFNTYNKCLNSSDYSYTNDKSKGSFHLSFRPGVQFATLDVDDVSNAGLDADFPNETSFRIGLEMELILPFNNKKWSVTLEPTYQEYNSRRDYLIDEFFPVNREVSYASIEVPLSVRYYSFLSSNHQLFINAGIAYDIGIGDNEINGIRTRQLDLNAQFNPVFGIGYQFNKKFVFEFRYQAGRDLLFDYTAASSKYNSASLILGYKLF